MPSLPKDHAFMDRPYSGKAILFDMLRTEKVVKIRDYEKKLKASGRKITALPRILYWVGKAVEEYGYDLMTESNNDGDVTSVSLVKREGGPVKPSKKAKSTKPAKKEKKSSKKVAKPAKKTKPVKKTSKKKKDETESESESAESESEPESEEPEDESSEE